MSTKKEAKKEKPAALSLKIERSLKELEIPELGNRGLKPYIFSRFVESFNENGNLELLPSMEAILGEVKEKYPTSRFIARPKVHYSYYKSKFFAFLREEREKQLSGIKS